MKLAAQRAFQLLETKVIRRVRTEAGVRRYKQPIGSIIINDSLMVGLTDKGTDRKGRSIIEGANGKTYTIGLEKTTLRGETRKAYVLRDDKGNQLFTDSSELEAYVELARQVQTEAGIDTRGPGGLPGSGGKREGWSNNQVQAASDEIAAWGNSMEEYRHGLQYALYGVADSLAEGPGAHRNIRVARHQLEQLREQAREADQDPDNANIIKSSGTAESVLDSAIHVAITEGKLRGKYDPEVEAAYAEEALRDAAANANTPRPVKTSELSEGMWVRSVDNDGNPKGDWFQILRMADQSRTGRSKLIRGKRRDGSRVDLFQQGPRDKWETIADASNEPAYVPPAPPTPDIVSKPVYRLSKGDYTTIGGETGYVADYVEKDDFSTPERRKNPVYKVEISDDRAGKVNKRTVTVPKGTVSGPEAENPVYTSTMADVERLAAERRVDVPDSQPFFSTFQDPHGTLSPAESEYDGYEKIQGANGRVFYVQPDYSSGTTMYRAYDENDVEVAKARQHNGVLQKLSALSQPIAEIDTADEPKVTDSTVSSADKANMAKAFPNLRPVDSEYDDYNKFVGANGREFYIPKRGDIVIAYDKDDNEVARGPWLEAVYHKLNEMGAEEVSASASTERQTQPYRERFKEVDSEYEGYAKYIGDNGKEYYVAAERGQFVIYDSDDNELGRVNKHGQDLIDWLNEDNTVAPSRAVAEEPSQDLDRMSVQQLRELARNEGLSTATKLTRKAELIRAIQKMRTNRGSAPIAEVPKRDPKAEWRAAMERAGKTPTSSLTQRITEKEPQAALLKRLKSKFDGWKRFKLPDGRVVDTGQATDDDNRWYATGPGGWDEIIADGDSEEEMMAKLRAVATPSDVPVSFSPGNTDVVPKRSGSKPSPIAGMTQEQYDAQKRRISPTTRDAILGTAAPSQGRGSAGGNRGAFDVVSQNQVLPQNEDEQLRQDIQEAASVGRNAWRSATLSHLTDMSNQLAAIPNQDTNLKNLYDAMNQMRRDHNAGRMSEENVVVWLRGRADMKKHERAKDILHGTADAILASRPESERTQPMGSEGGPINIPSASAVEIREAAKAKRVEALRAAREDANKINQGHRSQPATHSTRISALDAGVEQLRAGKPLKDADRKLLNMYPDSNGVPNRLKDPSNINLHNRLMNFSITEPGGSEANRALRNRATENYLNGMTHAAAWKEALETAERIPVATHVFRQEGTRDGRGQYVVMRRNPDGTSEEVATYRPRMDDRQGVRAGNEARGRMTLENTKAREAAARSVPVSGPVGSAPTPESPSVATTAGTTDPSVRQAEIKANVRMVYDQYMASVGREAASDNWMPLARVRSTLDAAGYSRSEQDEALIMLNRAGGGANVIPEANQKTLTAEQRAAAVRIGNQEKHLISFESPTQIARREAIEARLEAERNPKSVDVTENPLINPDRDSVTGSIKGSRALDAMTYEERFENLRPYFTNGSNFVRGASEGMMYAQRKHERGLDYDIDMTEAEVAAGLRPRGDVGAKRRASTETDAAWTKNPSGVKRPAEQSVVNEAKTITEIEARALARSNPERFFRVVAERYFRPDGTFKGLKYREAYDELNRYADMLASATTLPSQDGTVQSILMQIRVGHAGMMGIGRTMMTIRKVLNEEYGR